MTIKYNIEPKGPRPTCSASSEIDAIHYLMIGGEKE